MLARDRGAPLSVDADAAARLDQVRRWLEQLHHHVHLVPDLHPRAARAVLDDTVADLLTQLPPLLDRPAPQHTVFVASRTVFTVALEWCAVLLGRGGAVTLKAPRGLEAWYQALATNTPLPLRATTRRDALLTADQVVLMGSDATVAAVRAALPETTALLAFGSRHSVAWWTDPASADALAADVARYDGRGCMSPAIIYSPLPDAPERLAAALRRVRRELPLGTLSSAEAAHRRARRALATVAGRVVGDEVIQLPAPLAEPAPSAGLTQVVIAERFGDLTLDPRRLSVLGTDAERLRGVRCEPLGRMQRPPVDRLHDGVRWTDALVAVAAGRGRG